MTVSVMGVGIVRMRVGNGRVCMRVYVLGYPFMPVVVMEVVVGVGVRVLNRLVDMLMAVVFGDMQPHA